MIFYLFGYPIQNSVSPKIHNFIFKEFNLEHKYYLFETNSLKDIINYAKFKGASITIPFKEKILPYINILDPASLKIGAVNTILKKENQLIYGFNTDWVGIIKPLIKINNKKWNETKVLILGAGGTSRAAIYGLQTLNCNNISIFNRTLDKAIKLAKEFKCFYIEDLNQINDIDIIISTVPASIKYTLPKEIFKFKPIIFDVNYYPETTALTQQAIYFNCKYIKGIDMLIYQAIEQNKIWTKNEMDFDKIKNYLK
jgi:shikimate dehydrogenase